ncbi:MAG TPA: HEAT repeat domain-containing protein [Nitrospirota bacterium]
MHERTIIVVITATIAVLLLLIAIMFFTSIFRRVYNKRRYQKLDRLREVYGKRLREALASGSLRQIRDELIAPPQSNTWQVIEDILLQVINEEQHQAKIKELFSGLGYITFHEKQLESRNVQARALSIDKLGKMKSEASSSKLIPLLDDEDPEIVSVAVRSLTKIGGQACLQALVSRLPVLLGRSVAGKAMEIALLAFGPEAIPSLVDQKGGDDPWAVSCILEVLSRLPSDPRSIRLAALHLTSQNAEVRSKALKVLGRPESARTVRYMLKQVLPLLRDPVWYVRLQAIRSARELGQGDAAAQIGELLFDKSWQVRNEAAQALIVIGEGSLDIFLGALAGADKYAKDSVCEEIEKTDFAARLMEHLKGPDQGLEKKSQRILETMHFLGFSTPFYEYLERGNDKTVKDRIRNIMKAGARA